jgi:hypothetical protein
MAVRKVFSFFLEHNIRRNKKIFLVILILIGIWFGAIIFTSVHHEFWRDEVRAWSLARAASSPRDLIQITQHDGTPLVWYTILYLGLSLVDSTLVLPVASITIALISIIVFIFFSPFPIWIKILFMFSVLPFYEYSVMARNYGISMLLLFLFASIYPERRSKPGLLGTVLAILANTNVHSIMLACILSVVWVWDTFTEFNSISKVFRHLTIPFIILISGVTFSLWTTFPRPDTVLTDLTSINALNLLDAVTVSLLQASNVFSELANVYPLIMFELLLFTTILGLLIFPNLFTAGLISQVSLGMFFSLIYPGFLRHQGLFLVFLIVLYWIAIQRVDKNTRFQVDKFSRQKILHYLFWIGRTITLPAILFGGLISSNIVIEDIKYPTSSSKSFAEFLNTSPEYSDAILIPDPDYYLESLPFYTTNPIYFTRESRYGNFVSWTTASKLRLSLDDLLSTAYKIKEQEQRPILLVLGHPDMESHSSGESHFWYDRVFTWTEAEMEYFEKTTQLVVSFDNALSDENYRVYTLR